MLSLQPFPSLFLPHLTSHTRLQLKSVQRSGRSLGHSKVLNKLGLGSAVLGIHVSFKVL